MEIGNNCKGVGSYLLLQLVYRTIESRFNGEIAYSGTFAVIVCTPLGGKILVIVNKRPCRRHNHSRKFYFAGNDIGVYKVERSDMDPFNIVGHDEDTILRQVCGVGNNKDLLPVFGFNNISCVIIAKKSIFAEIKPICFDFRQIDDGGRQFDVFCGDILDRINQYLQTLRQFYTVERRIVCKSTDHHLQGRGKFHVLKHRHAVKRGNVLNAFGHYQFLCRRCPVKVGCNNRNDISHNRAIIGIGCFCRDRKHGECAHMVVALRHKPCYDQIALLRFIIFKIRTIPRDFDFTALRDFLGKFKFASVLHERDTVPVHIVVSFRQFRNVEPVCGRARNNKLFGYIFIPVIKRDPRHRTCVELLRFDTGSPLFAGAFSVRVPPVKFTARHGSRHIFPARNIFQQNLFRLRFAIKRNRHFNRNKTSIYHRICAHVLSRKCFAAEILRQVPTAEVVIILARCLRQRQIAFLIRWNGLTILLPLALLVLDHKCYRICFATVASGQSKNSGNHQNQTSQHY